MPLGEQRFTGITPQRFSDLAAKVHDMTGITVEGNAGTAAKAGYGLKWSYDPAALVLAIQVLAKPALVPAGVVQNKIKKLVEG
jgi:hypothetical protein